MTTPTGQVALWWWRHHAINWEVYDSEEEAAAAAAYMEEGDNAVPAGAQFPDGRLAACDEGSWPAFDEALRRLREADRQVRDFAAAQERRPVRKITAPFGGGQIEIDADEPAWLGTAT